jgi:hypothetical protein
MKNHIVVAALSLTMVGCLKQGTPTDAGGAVSVSSRTSLSTTVVGSMPNPPCGAGLVGVPRPSGIPGADPVFWSCVAPPVTCPANTVYTETVVVPGWTMTFCSPDATWGAPAPEPTPTPIPVVTPEITRPDPTIQTPVPTPNAPILLAGPRS